MRRRHSFGVLGGAVAAWPLAAQAQLPMPVIGFVSFRSLKDSEHLLLLFHRGLGETGYVESQNLKIVYRWAEGHDVRLPALAEQLVRTRVAVIAAFGGSASAQAGKGATTAIPIVISIGEDPVEGGYVRNINRPEGNITGVMLFTSVLGSKRLGLLREFSHGPIGVLLNLATASGQTQKRDVERAASELGQRSLLWMLEAMTTLRRSLLN